jgi:hypothetical protein
VRKMLILLAGASLLIASACSGDDDDDAATNGGYNDDVEQAFMSQCVPAAAGAPDPQGMCQCAFDGIKENVPFEEFKDFDEAVREDPNAPAPAGIEEATTACANEAIAGGTPTTTVAP